MSRSCRSGDWHLTLVHCGGGVLEHTSNVITFQVRVVREDLVDRSAGGELTEHHANRDPASRIAAHPSGTGQR